MLLSQGLLQNRSFALDKYAVPRLPPKQQVGWISNGDIYQLELVGDHIYYLFPPGTSILSTPYLGVMHLFGIAVASYDRTYSTTHEVRMETGLAALLMAAYAAVVFLTARTLLPNAWSLVVAFGATLGTQVWSGTSRVMWSDTWGVLLLGVTLFHLVGVETRRFRLRPVLLATLLCWMYFVRPTYSIAVAAICVWVLLNHRARLIPFALTGLTWLAGFVAYSEVLFHQPLPSYYRASRLQFADFGQALVGNLISPSRGLLVFVPVLFFVAYLLIRHRKQIALHKLAWLACGVIALHLIAVSGFSPWYGGHCYGPRYSTGLVPWLVLLTVLAVHAKRRASLRQMETTQRLLTRAEWAAGALLLGASIAINGMGAIYMRTAMWNLHPVNVDDAPDRVWDWRDPQFLRAVR